MAGNVWVLVEHWRGQVSEITYEVLALGREIADSLGVKLEAVLLASQGKALAASLGKADAVLYVDHPTLAEPLHEPYAEALVQMTAARQPRVVLVPLTNVTLGVGTFLAARLGSSAVNFCKDVQVSGGLIQARCVLYGGKMEATVAVNQAPAVLGIWPGARTAEQGRAPGAPAVEEVAVSLPDAPRCASDVMSNRKRAMWTSLNRTFWSRSGEASRARTTSNWRKSLPRPWEAPSADRAR